MKKPQHLRPLTQEEERALRRLAEEIVKHNPSLTHLLLALAPSGSKNPLQGLN